MPRFRNSLPAQGKNHGFDLRRTPVKEAIEAIITCDDFLVCDTHYWHGRTVPCEREVNDDGRTIDDSACAACREKQAFRTHVYVSAFHQRLREHFIFECTANAAKPLEEYRDANATLRGCHLYANRPKGTPNGKVSIITNSVNLAKVPQLPQPPDLMRALCIIWRVPLTGMSHQLVYDNDTATVADPSKFATMRNQPNNAADPPTVADVLHTMGTPGRNGNGRPKQPATAHTE